MNAVLLVAVVADGLAIENLREEGGADLALVPGRGLGFPEHMRFFGLTYRGAEQVLLAVLDKVVAERLVARLNRGLDLLTSFQGLAFCLEIEHLSGRRADRVGENQRHDGARSSR